jgi:hypothetical protein
LLMSKLNPKQQSLSGIGENHESKIVQWHQKSVRDGRPKTHSRFECRIL